MLHPIERLRAELRRLNVDGFLVPRADEHLGEYVPPSAERLAWLTGFTGSAGVAVVLADRAAVFTDGRYTLQLAQQTDPALWERRHITDEPAPAWLAAAAPGARIGYDPWLFAEEGLARYTAAGITLVPLAANPLDAVWTERPAPPDAPAIVHGLAEAGLASAQKRHALAADLRARGEGAAVLSDPASIAWLLNIRGNDVAFTPTVLAFALLHADGHVALFIDAAKVTPALRDWLGNEVTIAARAALEPALLALSGSKLRVDPAGTPAWFAQTLRRAGAEVVAGSDPCLLPKACKNPVEQQGARDCHVRDAVAICRFLHFLHEAGPGGQQTEISAAAALLEFRQAVDGFRGESFPAISGAGEHGAIIHYRVTPVTDRALKPDELYLIDSGGQYRDGTTDITRTVWTGPSVPPAALCDHVTRVLKGMIAIATLVFPQGVAGPHLDAFARRALWQVGLDYDHGTGHGVGSYLSVHEGPAGLSRSARPVAFAPGMILSDEPGYYLADGYGIRLENLLMVQPMAFAPDAAPKKPFLCFETLTLAPFDRRLIAAALLTNEERRWLDAYHACVEATVGPLLEAATAAWLATACAPLEVPDVRTLTNMTGS